MIKFTQNDRHAMGSPQQFLFVLLKPSHYDDDGYVIQFLRSAIPSNTLACLNGLALDCNQRRVLGDDVEIVVEAYDEANTLLPLKRIARQLRGRRGMVGLVGVQSNQFPRAMDIARPLREAGIPVAIGGFHVSGCLAMLPVIPPELQEAMDLGISLFAGEAEGRLDDLMRDAWHGRLKPLYNYISDLPALESAPVPFLQEARVRRTAGRLADAGVKSYENLEGGGFLIRGAQLEQGVFAHRLVEPIAGAGSCAQPGHEGPFDETSQKFEHRRLRDVLTGCHRFRRIEPEVGGENGQPAQHRGFGAS